MTPEQLKETRIKLNLTQKQMAEELNTPYRTYQSWELGDRRVPGIIKPAIKCLIKRKGK